MEICFDFSFSQVAPVADSQPLFILQTDLFGIDICQPTNKVLIGASIYFFIFISNPKWQAFNSLMLIDLAHAIDNQLISAALFLDQFQPWTQWTRNQCIEFVQLMIWITFPSFKTVIYLILSNWPARFALSLWVLTCTELVCLRCDPAAN